MTQQMPDRVPGGAMDLSHLVAANTQQPPQPSPNGRGSAGAATGVGGQVGSGETQPIEVPSLVVEVTDANFEQIAQLSGAVPVVFSLWSPRAEASQTLDPVLEQLTNDQGGRLLLAKVDVDANPALAQAFQAQAVPTVIALIGGRPVPLFQGSIPEAQVRDFFTQLVQLAEQQGMAGRLVVTGGAADQSSEPAEPPINPAHADALEAATRGDFAAAIEAYEQVLLKAPADHEARAALMQVRLLDRLQGVSADEIRSAAAADPANLDAQLRVADLDVSGGHVEDAFLRLLDLFGATADDNQRAKIREHLIELFEVVGVADPRVIAARGKLANLLY